MRSMMKWMKTGWPMLLSGIVVVLALYGCSTPLVDVKVVTCGQNTTVDDGDPGDPGACRPINYAASAVGFWYSPGSGQVPVGSSATCSATSTKCKVPPGTCTNGKNCRSYYNATTFACWCGCTP